MKDKETGHHIDFGVIEKSLQTLVDHITPIENTKKVPLCITMALTGNDDKEYFVEVKMYLVK